MADPKPCTCHPDEAPKPCPQKYAFGACRDAALVARLRNTPNWKREAFGGSWKEGLGEKYDRAPFEAADRLEELAALSPAPTVPEGSVVLPKAAWDFLMGAGELDGRSFGERHPTRSGAFWWRSYITAMLAARCGGVVPDGNPRTPACQRQSADR